MREEEQHQGSAVERWPGQSHWVSRLSRTPLAELMDGAAALSEKGHGRLVSYSRKVFIPLTKLCRDVCHYCTFAERPHQGSQPYLTPDDVLAIARAGAAAGCHEALFTLGDKPELRYAAAADALRRINQASTLSYLAEMCALVVRETGLLPHINPGVMTQADITMLRPVSASMGLMLESASERLCAPGEVHYGSPDKAPRLRLETLRIAGEMRVPFTTGILIGIGETRQERIAALDAIADLHRRYGHIQEVIIQNFRAKPGTRRARAPEPSLEDLLWTIAAARLILGPDMNIQAPPNLSPSGYSRLIAAGINDWGGISPVTIDHVNPEAPWPQIEALRKATAAEGKILVERLPVYPRYVRSAAHWVDARVTPLLLRHSDAEGFARTEAWAPGLALPIDRVSPLVSEVDRGISDIVRAAERGMRLDERQITRLFSARDIDFAYVVAAADALRQNVTGDVVRFVVNRNINYTNICSFRCQFCAFSKGKTAEALRGGPYDLALGEIVRRAEEAWARGATEVCLQGGIHPEYSGATYLAICRAVRAALPEIHIHAFSPLEIAHGATTLRMPVPEFLTALKEAGLDTLPGTAAEILDDDVRKVICPDKVTTREWLHIVESAHAVGLPSTATIMFGHMEDAASCSRHLLAIRDLQERTGGFTEFVPLPFVAMEAPLFLKGRARRGPTGREAVLMHAVARLVLHPLIQNIQTSWVKMGVDGVKRCLAAGANDLGGTLMNESISRAAGTQHGQEMPPAEMCATIGSLGRTPMQRDTLYRPASPERQRAAISAAPLRTVVQTSPSDPRALANAIR
ncbi:MAG TPA: 5-amino-6-(D-ribitylamino)uracil--L-tyrosine 4-hydroxyphenyl transferase CofH [Stellaceae bacterium]|nr:5-amino-6-(D-ribitylamino)uracil--L-tyrosine 4-hydroxyphenyl transferase CofH [Stellaceae bacterium]